MLAVKLKGQITSDRKLKVKLPKDIEPGAVEVIVLHEAPLLPAKTRTGRARRKTAHPAFGIWADRTDITDSAAFASQLRQQIQNQKDRRG